MCIVTSSIPARRKCCCDKDLSWQRHYFQLTSSIPAFLLPWGITGKLEQSWN